VDAKSTTSSIAGNVLTKRRSAMTEGMANAIMCCKYWLGFDEFTPQDMIQEQGIAEEGLEADVDLEAGDDDE